MDESWIVKVLACVGGVCAYLWGPWDALIAVLLTVIVIDYITGFLGAAIQGKLSSEVGFKGLCKKVLILALVAVATLLDKVIPAANSALRATVILFYVANECLSILENAGTLGLPLPKFLKKMLVALQKQHDPDTDETTDIR